MTVDRARAGGTSGDGARPIHLETSRAQQGHLEMSRVKLGLLEVGRVKPGHLDHGVLVERPSLG